MAEVLDLDGRPWRKGDRLVLVIATTFARPGMAGTVDMVDSQQTIHVHWDPARPGLASQRFGLIAGSGDVPVRPDTLYAICPAFTRLVLAVDKSLEAARRLAEDVADDDLGRYPTGLAVLARSQINDLTEQARMLRAAAAG